MGKARDLANLGQLPFQKELGKRGIPWHYSKKDLEIDLKNLGLEL